MEDDLIDDGVTYEDDEYDTEVDDEVESGEYDDSDYEEDDNADDEAEYADDEDEDGDDDEDDEDEDGDDDEDDEDEDEDDDDVDDEVRDFLEKEFDIDEDVTEEDINDDLLDDDYEKDVSDELLDDVLGDEPEDDEPSEPVDDGGPPSDELVAAAMYKSDRHGDWFAQAKEDGVNIDDRFAAMIGRTKMGMDTLTENSIYSMEDLLTYVSSIEERVDPEAVLVPAEDDEEGWANFEKEVLGVPESPDQYPEELFEGTFFEDAEAEKLDSLRSEVHKRGFMEGQLEFMVDYMNNERESHLEEQENNERDYRAANKNALDEYFGDQLGDVTKDVNRFLHKYGAEFLKEFRQGGYKGKPVLSSASFVKMLYNSMNDISSPTKIGFSNYINSLERISDEKILQLEDKLENNKYIDDKYSKSSDKKLRRAHKLAHAKLRAVVSEIDKRGL